MFLVHYINLHKVENMERQKKNMQGTKVWYWREILMFMCNKLRPWRKKFFFGNSNKKKKKISFSFVPKKASKQIQIKQKGKKGYLYFLL
jgi:hypothetical protein